MRLIFDMAFKSILRGLQHVLLCVCVIVPKTYCCGFLNFRGYCQIVILSWGFKSVAPDGYTVHIYI